MSRTHPCVLITLLVSALAPSPSLAGDPQSKPVTSVEAAHDDHAEMEELIGRVEVRLRKIDRLLSDAAAGDTSALSRVGPSGIDELLKHSRDDAQTVVTDIDRILELAEHPHPPGAT